VRLSRDRRGLASAVSFRFPLCTAAEELGAGVWACARKVAAAARILALVAVPAAAEPLPPLRGPVLLTVTGAIEVTNAAGEARFDLSLLESLPQRSYTTSTIWTDGRHTFTGVLLRDLLLRVGARGQEVEAIALNDYAAKLSTREDVTGEAPLLAYRIDGRAMSIRDKGPIWLIYPFDSHPFYRSEEIYARSVWQLIRLDVHD